MDNLLAQLVGFVAYALGIAAFYQRDDKRLKIVMATQNLIYMTHFWLLGAHAAAMGSLLSFTRTTLSIYTRQAWIALTFITITLAIGAWNAQNLLDFLPSVAVCFGTAAVFLLRGIPMRLVLLCGSTCWLINNILVHSIGGVLLEITVITMNLITIFRLSRKRELTNEHTNQSTH